MSTDKELRELCETFADWWSTQHVPDIATPDYIAFKAYKAAHAEAQAEIEALRKEVTALRNLAIGYKADLVGSDNYEIRISEAEHAVNKFIDTFRATMASKVKP